MAHIMKLISYRPRDIAIRCYNKIVITDDGSTIVALHQDRDFPYEHSRPLPKEPEARNDGVLQMENKSEIYRVFKQVKPEIARKQLCAMTLTTEHRWFPRARDKKAKKTEMNRPYL